MTVAPSVLRSASRAACLFVLLVLGAGCGRSALVASALPDAGTGRQDSSPTAGVSNTWQPPANGKCQDGFTACGKGDALRCYDLNRSKDHCGACGHACPLGLACQAGTCQQHHCKGGLSFKALPVISTADKDYPDPVLEYLYRPVLGDFDADGRLDLVGVSQAGGPMSLLYGSGDGTFPTQEVIDSDSTLRVNDLIPPWQAFAADVNGDGFLDLLSVGGEQSVLTVRFGSGNRSQPFGERTDLPTRAVPASVLVADFDADGQLDMVARVDRSLEYWRGQDGGRFEHQATFDLPDWRMGDGDFIDVNRPVGPLATDWNGDGVLDWVYGSGGNLHFRLGRADGSFDSEVACALGEGIVGDLDHDNRPDAVSGSNVLLGLDRCGFSQIVPLQSNYHHGLALADLDGDGNLDIVADLDTKVTVRLGDGKGGFAQALSLPGTSTIADESSTFLVGDLNQDSKLDLVFVRRDGWGVFLNTCP
jgi:FG-GAP-like repeat